MLAPDPYFVALPIHDSLLSGIYPSPYLRASLFFTWALPLVMILSQLYLYLVLYYPAPFQARLDYTLNYFYKIVNQLLVDVQHTKNIFYVLVLGCGLPIYFRTSISFLPYRTYARHRLYYYTYLVEIALRLPRQFDGLGL